MAISFNAQANPDLVLQLCRRIATDDDFRASLERDPQTTLLPYGVQVSAGESIAVPPKDKMADFIQYLEGGPLSASGMAGGGGVHYIAFVAFFAFMA